MCQSRLHPDASSREEGSRETVTSAHLVKILGQAQAGKETLPLADRLGIAMQLTDVILDILATDAEVQSLLVILIAPHVPGQQTHLYLVKTAQAASDALGFCIYPHN